MEAGTLAESDLDEFWYPPFGTPIYFADAEWIPCNRKKAKWWTYNGAVSWYLTSSYPPPATEDEE